MRTRTNQLTAQLQNGEFDTAFTYLYAETSQEECRKRYLQAIQEFEKLFGSERDCVMISAPGRTEVGGNHTDHQHGRVLAASVNLDIICIASPNADSVIRIHSKGYDPYEIKLDDLLVQKRETGTSAALIRGVARWFSDNGHSVVGFDAYTVSDVLGGSGLSSSAAFEVAVGNILRVLGENDVSPIDIAIAGCYAENEYFGKPSGLMDQMSSSVGGFVAIDFANPQMPIIRKLVVDLAKGGYHLCIVDTRGSHADLTRDYAEIPAEMAAVAACFEKEYLRDVQEELFYANIARVSAATGERAVLRAIHYFTDDHRVPQLVEALEAENYEVFCTLINQSGRSSCDCLQNIFSASHPKQQELMLALTLSAQLLEGKGAWRVHGGGFAGTIQAFVPTALLAQYSQAMADTFGPNACQSLNIRPVGGIEVTTELGMRAL